MKRLGLALLIAALAAPVFAQTDADTTAPDTTALDPDGHYAVFHADGAAADFDAVVTAMADADVVFLGELHNDPVAHALQLRLLEAAHRTYGEARPVALSLEMIERDAQLVLNEYLAGLIRERDFLAASRPWSNYRTDYRPLVEYARAHGLAVVAANAPGRYVSRTGREGAAGLAALGDEAHPFLAPLPVPPPSEAYAAKFRAQMDALAGHGASHAKPDSTAQSPHDESPHGGVMPSLPTLDDLLAAQNLRDATMAFSVAEHLGDRPGALVVHVTGAFHSAGGLGTPEHLAHYAPDARVLIVTFDAEEDFRKAPQAEAGTSGFVIHTDQALRPAE